MRKFFWNAVFFIFLAIFITTVAIFGKLIFEKRHDASTISDLRDKMWSEAIIESTTGAVDGDENAAHNDQLEKPVYHPPGALLEIMEENPNVIGWIKVEDTDIDYPIMYNKEEYEYYLKRDPDGNRNAAGSIFLDCVDNINVDGLHLVYGHHMKAGFKGGTMFRDVTKFEGPDFMASHKVMIYTKTRLFELKPVYIYNGKADVSYREAVLYHHDPNEFIKEKTGVETDADNIFVLITCAYDQNDARTYLICEEQ